MRIGAVEARTGALLLSGQAGGDVKGSLIWSLADRAPDGRTNVPYVVEVDGRSLMAGRTRGAIAVGLYAYVVDDDGRVVDHSERGVILDPAIYEDRITACGLKFSGAFALPAGRYALRVMVRNQRSERFFMSWSLVTVPSEDDSSPQLLPPLFPDEGSQWLMIRQGDTDDAVISGNCGGVFPSARPAVVEDHPAEVWLGGGGWGRGARVSIRIQNDVGRTVSEPNVSLSASGSGGFEFHRAVLSPIDLPPGEYTLIVSLTDDQSSEVLRRALPILVVREGEPPAWPASLRNENDQVLTHSESRPEPASKLRKNEIRSAYRRALRTLANGDAVSGRRQVADLERRVAKAPSRKALNALGEAEYAESKALAARDPACLMPLALLHRELYRSYLARSEGALAMHARKMTITSAQQLARLDPGNSFSSGLMVNFARDLAQAGASSAARALLEQTLYYSPDYQPALLSLGFSFERSGEYFDAAVNYRRSVDIAAGSDEGRLRLAINLIRTGRAVGGVEHLRRLIRGPARPWIQKIAAQELVRYLIERGEMGEAERVARQALVRLPEDQRIHILLAAILEQSNRHGQAIEQVRELPPASRGVSPRARYGEWPALGTSASQVTLNSLAGEALPVLQSALADGGGAR
ncbi:MAG: hypothetical protein LJE93_13585 [Acidobacteria bacterium]|jgi:tetratricopeptide (TPR) repeat protein|nr:hypothetical protein [Acidobacteriota bacterium]